MPRRWVHAATVIAAVVAALTEAPAVAYGPTPPRAASVIFSIRTNKQVVFLTIDDGWYRDPRFLAVFQRAHVPTALFLINDAAKEDYDYFRTLQSYGATIEDHTLTHPDCSKLTRPLQEQQICGTADAFARVFGRRPTLFRPTYGRYDLATQQAAAACRMHALVYWDVTVNKGRLQYAVGDHLRPGDIILMHFRPEIRTDFAAALRAIRSAGLGVARLEDFV